MRYRALEALDVLDPDTMQPVPRDGETLGEVMFRGNVVMKGYLKNQKSRREAAFAGGWFHSGDLGVMHPDGYIQLKDRSKDIIISGGENISSIEVEDALYKHPAVQAAAVVAKPDDKWGETPCAFVELKPGQTRDRRRADRVVQEQPRRLQGAAPHRVRGTAEDEHREDSEIQTARDGEGGVSAAIAAQRILPASPCDERAARACGRRRWRELPEPPTGRSWSRRPNPARTPNCSLPNGVSLLLLPLADEVELPGLRRKFFACSSMSNLGTP